MASSRDSINGCWILDKSREAWSMNSYLKTLHVDPLAIEAHEKGEKEVDTLHTIHLDRRKLKIVKRSRVNNDFVVELVLGKENVETLPGNRTKTSVAHSNGPAHVQIESSLLTVNGKASVSDIKELIEEEGKIVLKQTLSIRNEDTKESSTTTRYFLPYLKTPPHEEEKADSTTG